MPQPYVVTRRDPVTGALFARNAWRAEFGERIAFADLSGLQTSWTCDRTEFLGRHGAVDRPAALAEGRQLSGRAGAGLDPCAALQTEIELAPDARAEITFLLGDAASPADGQALIATYRDADVEAVLQDVAALERDGWDGAWYRRGYYDDGTPLGSASSDECKIDAIAQSWSVMSGAADPARAAQAMAAVDAHLVDRDTRVAMLFTPPFDRAEQDPGYIKGYPPGIRENGGQYTHGSVWSVFAWAELGDGDRAGELFDVFNPIRHAASAEAVERYKVEPYVSCADVYSVAPLAGRGGWTWYTGSAGWLYRAGLEAMLGFHVRGNRVLIDPCIPKAWSGFSITYRRRSSRYVIEVENPAGVSRGIAKVELDGVAVTGLAAGAEVPLHDDGAEHRVRIELG